MLLSAVSGNHSARRQGCIGALCWCGLVTLGLVLVMLGSQHNALKQSATKVIQQISSCGPADSSSAAALLGGVGGLAPCAGCQLSHAALARLRQATFCQDGYPLALQGAHVVKVHDVPGGLNMFVYTSEDEVSASIARGHGWETGDLQEILWALEQPLQIQSQVSGDRPVLRRLGSSDAAISSTGSAGTKPVGPLFVDVGANVGWFTLNVAARGYRVAAFEGMQDNIRLVRSSICGNSGFQNKITLYPFGLGNATSTCYLFSDKKNKGDGITMCGMKDEAAALAATPSTYQLRGLMHIERLDNIVQQDVKAMKMDVEGYEPYVIEGAEHLLRNHRVWFLLMEFNPVLLRGSLKGQSPVELLRTLQRHGYKISKTSFKGPFLLEPELLALADDKMVIPVNLYCVHGSIFG